VWHPLDKPVADPELLLGADAILDQVCARILEGEPLYGRPGPVCADAAEQEILLIAERVHQRMAANAGRRRPTADYFPILAEQVASVEAYAARLEEQLAECRKVKPAEAAEPLSAQASLPDTGLYKQDAPLAKPEERLKTRPLQSAIERLRRIW